MQIINVKDRGMLGITIIQDGIRLWLSLTSNLGNESKLIKKL